MTNAPAPIHTILVGVDGSPESIRAADFAGSLAAALGARVLAVHATGLLDVWPDDPHAAGTGRNSHEHVAEMMRGAWTDPLRARGIEPEIILRDGTPGMVLLALADDHAVDLIVVGSRGVGEADPYGLGSTATKVAQHSSRPVTVVPNHPTDLPPRPVP